MCRVGRAKRNPPFVKVMGIASLHPSYGTIRRKRRASRRRHKPASFGLKMRYDNAAACLRRPIKTMRKRHEIDAREGGGRGDGAGSDRGSLGARADPPESTGIDRD